VPGDLFGESSLHECSIHDGSIHDGSIHDGSIHGSSRRAPRRTGFVRTNDAARTAAGGRRVERCDL
jgi:hypothetical protein